MSNKRRHVAEGQVAAQIYARRVVLVGTGFVLALSLLSWRLIHIQYTRHGHYAEMAKDIVQKDILPARRGRIYGSRGDLLAGNKVLVKVAVDRNQLSYTSYCVRALAHAENQDSRDIVKSYSRDEIGQRYLERLAKVIATPLGKQPWEIIRAVTQAPRNKVLVTIVKDLDESDADRLKEILAAERIFGVDFDETRKRFYPESQPIDTGARHP